MPVTVSATYPITYASNGNITNKYDAGQYVYFTTPRPYRLMDVYETDTNYNNGVGGKFEYLDYNYFNKATLIELGGSKYSLYYGVDKQRIKSIDSIPQRKTVRYYFGSYEKEIINDTATHIDYIFAPSGLALIVKTNIATAAVGKGVGGIGDGIAITHPGIPSGYDFYYVSTDNLGSIALITNTSKTVLSKYYYQPFGGRVLLTGTDITPRGYTFHEHLATFGLINMNGRFYDPVLARFLSPDPYVQMPDFTQNYNRYAYALNNPFKFTDPSGEVFVIDDIVVGVIVGAMIGAFVNAVTAGYSGASPGQIMASFGIGAATGAFGAWTGAGGMQVAGVITNALLQSATCAVVMGSSAYLQNGVNNLIDGESWGLNGKQSFWTGFITGAITGAIQGGINGYKLAQEKSLNIWWGNKIKYGRTQWSFWNVEKPYATVNWEIKNVSSMEGNNCVPTSFAEASDYFGNDVSYEKYEGDRRFHYEKGVGANISPRDYLMSLYQDFDSEVFPKANFLQPEIMQQVKESGSLINANFKINKSMRHADNLRSIKYYSNKIVLKFRIGSYRYSQINDSWYIRKLSKILYLAQ